jgi:tRNA A-37 threonylcarbamoyl transferase component Bud32
MAPQRVTVPGAGCFLAVDGLSGSGVRSLLDAHDATREDARILKALPNTRITHVTLDAGRPETGPLGTREVLVKEARLPCRRELARRLGGRSRFRHDFTQAQRLVQRGVATPSVLACTLRGLDRSEYTITRFLENALTLRQLFWLDGGVLTRPEERLHVLQALGPWIRRLHEAGVWQRDLKVHNIMVRDWTGSPSFQLVDISPIRFFAAPLSRARRVRNLGQVLDVPAHLDEEFTQQLLPSYLGDTIDPAQWLPDVRRAIDRRRKGRVRKEGVEYLDEARTNA